MYEFLKYEVAEGIATITLDRPEVYNALNDEITFELQAVLKACKKDGDVRVVVLTGEGKAFCSGQDLKSSAGKKRSFKDSLDKRYNPIIRAMRELPKPIICRLNGVAAGAGCSMALACDLIVASKEASLIEVFVNIGLVLDSGSSWFLPRAVGTARAFELATTGKKVMGEEAAELGLVNRCVEHDELDEAVLEYAQFYAKAPTKAIGIMKKMLNRSGYSSLEDMLEYESYCQEIAGSSEDHKEGVQAFLEKRKPEFKGN